VYEALVTKHDVNDIAEVKDWQDSQFYEGMSGSMSEGLFQNISYLDLCDGEMGMLGQVAVGGAGLLTLVRVARWKSCPAVEKCFLKFSIIVDL
jgi:hypothetical protein